MLFRSILGFILPLALPLAAVPLEYFIYSARTVFGVLLVIAIRGLAFVLRVIGNVVKQVGNVFVMLYDVVIFLPLLFERLIKTRNGENESVVGRARGIAAFPAKGRASG